MALALSAVGSGLALSALSGANITTLWRSTSFTLTGLGFGAAVVTCATVSGAAATGAGC